MKWLINLLHTWRIVVEEVDEEMRSEIEASKKEEPFIVKYRRWKEADEIIKNIPDKDDDDRARFCEKFIVRD